MYKIDDESAIQFSAESLLKLCNYELGVVRPSIGYEQFCMSQVELAFHTLNSNTTE